MTNYEKIMAEIFSLSSITNMSDAAEAVIVSSFRRYSILEMSNALSHRPDGCAYCVQLDHEDCKKSCQEGVAEWLQKEVKE